MKQSLLLLAALFALSLFAQSPVLVDLLEQADFAILRGRWAEADSLLAKAISEDPTNPTNPMILSNRAMLQYNMGRDSMALSLLDEAHRQAPSSVTILMNRARILTAIDSLDAAIEDYSTVISLDSLRAAPLYFRGLLALTRNDTVMAVADFTTLERIAPDSIDTNIAWATLASYRRDFPQVISRLNRVIPKDPSIDFILERAYALLMTGDLNSASEDISRVLTLDPECGEAYLYRAMLNSARYRYEDACNDARRAVRFGVDKSLAQPYLSHCN